jgi:hypothetical protein
LIPEKKKQKCKAVVIHQKKISIGDCGMIKKEVGGQKECAGE